MTASLLIAGYYLFSAICQFTDSTILRGESSSLPESQRKKFRKELGVFYIVVVALLVSVALYEWRLADYLPTYVYLIFIIPLSVIVFFQMRLRKKYGFWGKKK